MTRALITGASGFTGRYLAAALRSAGYDVHAIAQNTDLRAVGIGTIHACDLTDAVSCRQVVAALAPDLVIHLAAISFVAHDNPDDMYQVNLLGTRNLLDALARAPRHPAAVLIASSANIYGNRARGMLTEDTPVRPANDYGVSKAAAELLCGTYAADLPIIIARPFNYTGVGQSPRFLIPKIVDHVRRGERQIQLGNIKIARDFSDVRTLVDAYLRLLMEPKAIGGTFQICSGNAVSLETILDLIAELSGNPLSVIVDPSLVRTNEVPSLCGTPARIEALIGPLRHIPLRQTLEWMLNHDD